MSTYECQHSNLAPVPHTHQQAFSSISVVFSKNFSVAEGIPTPGSQSPEGRSSSWFREKAEEKATRAPEAPDDSNVTGESQFTSLCGESQNFHNTNDMPGPLPTESGIFKKFISFLRGKSEDGLTPEPQWGVETAVGVAVAGVMGVPTIAAGVLTLGPDVLIPGTDMKIPETGTMTGILRCPCGSPRAARAPSWGAGGHPGPRGVARGRAPSRVERAAVCPRLLGPKGRQARAATSSSAHLASTQSRAQPPEEIKRKPVLGKLGNLFTAGRRRNTRESPASSIAKSVPPKDVTSSKLPERENKNKSQGSSPKQTDTCEEGSPQKQPQESEELEDQHSESCFQAALPDVELPPGSSSPAAAAAQQCHESDSPQLEPLEAEGETFPGATTAAKQLHSSLENSSRRENAERPALRPGQDASPDAGGDQEGAQGAGGVPGSPTQERPGEGLGEAADRAPHVCATAGSGEPPDARGQPRENAPVLPGDPAAQGAENWAGSARANGTAGPRGRDSRPGGRAGGDCSRGGRL
ncbi:translation initiation factor IF-2-like [Talpa occidentalis]|uniref:translation initiation factor IF-2-like n=1 Tax=Talpa occidentalis TaxID=50954 RepID=UPI0023F67091|nr:translation initiation factor IF-2-like [Talpa occidentalis]